MLLLICALQPFYLRMMEDAAAFVRMEEERDLLRLKMDETARKCLIELCLLLLLRI